MIAPLIRAGLHATGEFGDAEMSGRILTVAWHLTTVVFACSAVALGLLGFGIVTDVAVARFIAACHAAFVLLGAAVVGRRLPAVLPRPVPISFFACLSAVAVLGWSAGR